MMNQLLGITLAAIALSVSASILIVWSQRWHGKHTLDHDLAGVQKFHTTAVPRIGGLAIVFAITAVLLARRGDWLAGAAATEHGNTALRLLIAGLPAFAAGIVEDLTKKVSVRARLFASIASALAASWLLGAIVREVDIWGVDRLLQWGPPALVVTAIVVAGGINAINIIDGFNGLAASIVTVMLAALGAVAWSVGDQLVAELAAIGAGAAIGFVFVNYPMGRIFLGDGGAYFLGFWVAEVGVLLLVRDPDVSAWQVLSICAYPVIEVLFSIYRRKIVRQASPGAPDALHLHTLVYRRVVTRFVRIDPQRPWKRNAAVVCVTLPWVAIAATLSVLVGDSLPGAVLLTLAQVVVYVAVYARLVRGHWLRRQPLEGAVKPAAQAESLDEVPARTAVR
ncbi:glycosyltransferase [Massilia solisilvae]|uniref:Glycosyltransferase n=1 Tax=Massilia solisilvae TaxID=1811225 RepID=A0ABT2BEY3_9BURK|nr:glycosyltransferase [Massilia solisilvae]MCS0606976.1 glycosyltransferase [Massilia solisilvae]